MKTAMKTFLDLALLLSILACQGPVMRADCTPGALESGAQSRCSVREEAPPEHNQRIPSRLRGRE